MDLSTITVLEVGEYVAAPYAGKLLSDLGADVIKVEPRSGDVSRSVGPFVDDDPGPEASEFFGYLNTGKRSVTLPEGGAASADFLRELIDAAGVDLIVESGLADYGIDPREFAAEDEAPSVVSVSGFGTTGPWREYDGPDLVSWAESGSMNKMGYPDSPPTRVRIKAVEYWAGLVGAIGGLAALLDETRQDAPGRHVDVAKREVGASSTENFIANYSYSGPTTERTGHGFPRQGTRSGSKTIYETADGYVTASIGGFPRWKTFVEEFLKRPELLEDERFESNEALAEHREEAQEIIEDHLRGEEKWDLFERLQENGIPSSVTATPEDVAGFDQLRAREFWDDLTLPNGETVTAPGFPFLVDGERPDPERAPRLGEHDGEYYDDLGFEYLPSADDRSRIERPAGGDPPSDDQDGDGPLPLSGIRVLDFSWYYAGPHATRLLSAMGADVIKVESEHKPDPIRAGHSYGFDSSPTSSVSPYYNEMNQGKRSIRLDLTNDRGRQVALDLMAEADVVMENFSPGFMSRIDLDHEAIREVNPEVIYLSMPGWGNSGPATNYRAYGLTIQSMAGLDFFSGFPEDPPTTAGHSWPDPTNGYFGLFAVLAALYHRERTGEGTYLESALFEVTVSLLHKPHMEYMNNGRMPERIGNRDEDRRFVQGAYPCRGEDRWAVVAVETDAQWERLCEVIGRAGLADDERFSSRHRRFENHDEVDEVIAEWTRKRSREEVRTRLQDHDVPAGIVANERDLLEYDPQLRAREYVSTQDHPEVGEQRFQGVPFELSGHDVEFRSRAPFFGEHTEEVLGDWLGMSDDDFREAEAADAFY